MFKKRFLTGLISCLFSAALLFSCVAENDIAQNNITQLPPQPQVKSMKDAVAAIKTAIAQADVDEKIVAGLQKKISSKPSINFTEEELHAFVNAILYKYGAHIPEDAKASLYSVFNFLSKKMSTYNISGVAFAFDPNVGLLNDNQNPRFTAVFKNSQGAIKKRTFDCRINSVGLKVALGINFAFIFFTGDIDFENSNQVLKLGTGIDISTAFIPIPLSLLALHAPFTNAPGGLTMIGGSLGVSMGLSMVTGGTLTPRHG